MINTTSSSKSHPMWRTIALLLASASVFFAPHLLAEDWPHWRGPRRDDITTELSGWRDGQWRLTAAWERNVGEGSTSPLVVGNHVYTMGWRDNEDHVYCLDAASGDVIWTASYPSPRYGRLSTGDKGLYSGVTSTPEYDPATGLLYTLGIDGDLQCWDTNARGRKLWGINLYESFDPPQRPDVGGKRGGASLRDYGYTTSPLVHEDTLVVEVGSRRGTVMGFDKRTGRLRWSSAYKDEAGHSGGLVPMNVQGVPCAVVLTLRHLLIVRLDPGHEGETLAQHPWTTDFANNIPTPVVHGNSVLVTSAYNQYAMCRLDVTLAGAKVVWQQNNPSGVCSPVLFEGHVYWAWRGVHCVDFVTGEQRWQGGNVGSTGSCLITGDQRLVVLANRGDLFLIETAGRSPASYRELAAQRGLFRQDSWSHVTLANSRLLCRDRDGNMKCFLVGDAAE